MKIALIAGFSLGLSTLTALAAPPPYCGQQLAEGQKPSPVCANARLRAIEADLAKAFDAARKRLAASSVLVAALEQDEARFLAQRDTIVANLEKVDPYNRKEKAEFHDPANIMRKRIAFLARIDGTPRKTLIGEWGGADGYLSIHPREHGYFVSLNAKRKDLRLDYVEDWLCRGMGDLRSAQKSDLTQRSARIYRGDGEDLPSRSIKVSASNGMVEVVYQAAGRRKRREPDVCEGNITPPPFRLLPLLETH
ncbi:MAG: hypothetical protein CFE31_08225 [Rhizobiales bacterium PAR1]|nr:MAG: hypothetical protein CFE31_08225 [Rhizobiales bacterium PAR1]